MKIPEGYIEDADFYSVLPAGSDTPIEIGGRIMMRLVVLEQMHLDNIIATTGIEGKGCLILVDYTYQQVLHKLNTAKQHINGWADKQAREELEGLKDE